MYGHTSQYFTKRRFFKPLHIAAGSKLAARASRDIRLTLLKPRACRDMRGSRIATLRSAPAVSSTSVPFGSSCSARVIRGTLVSQRQNELSTVR